MNINTKELRQHLSEYLDRASRGHSIEISMRGKPVAVLTSLMPKATMEEDALFGLWADRGEMDVEAEVHAMRQGRSF